MAFRRATGRAGTFSFNFRVIFGLESVGTVRLTVLLFARAPPVLEMVLAPLDFETTRLISSFAFRPQGQNAVI
jgi:hypothetical protein